MLHACGAAVCAEETAAPVQAETAEIGDGYVTLVSDSNQLIPVYVDEEAEGAVGTVEQAMSDFSVGGTIMGLINDSGIYDIIKGNWKSAVMILISFVLLYLAIVKQFEPLLLMPIAFGMLLTNLPLAGIMDEPIYEIISNPTYHGKAGIPIYNGDMLVGYQYIKQNGGLLYYLYQGVKLGIFPPLIFMGVGSDDRLWSADRQSDEPAARRCRSAGHLPGVHHRPAAGFHAC